MHWNPRQVPLAQPLCTCVHDNVPMSYICMLQQEEIVTELYTRGELMEEEKGRDDCPSSTEDEEDKDLKKIKESVGYIFREADWIDNILMILGTLGCFADGSSTPVIMLVLSNMMNSYATATSFTLHDINKDALNFVYVAIGVGLGALLEGLCWARTAERQTSTLRKKYLSSLLKQEPAFFDTFRSSSTTFQVVSSLSTDTLTIQDAISEKIPNFLMSTATFLVSQTAALYLSWRLAVVTIPTLSLLILPGIVYGKILMDLERKIQEAYALAGGIAEQALSSIRTVFSYVGENKTAESFSEALEKCSSLGIKQGLMKGMAIGSIGVAFAVWAFQAWYGSVLVTEKGARGGDVFTSGVCVVVGGLALGGALANLKYLSEALVATSRVYEVIDRIPSIDPQGQDGETMTNIRGEIEFKDVDFAYPSRPKSMVLEKFNLRIEACQTLGLVGASGSGKSTLILLLERFYAPVNGEIVLDGVSIEKLQLTWLRQQIGLVSQEPALFQTSIKENIMFAKECASMEEVIRAAKAANAHSFIKQLPKGYDTQVGQYGSQLSGGQKQRIAIARALLREPKILLLDEATSALDSESEKVVQDALIHASVGRTTIIVAHRLSTLHKADLIAVLQSGEVIESGPHNQLIENTQGIYSTMLKLQQISIMDNPYMTGKASNEERAPAYTEDTKSVNLWKPDQPSNQETNSQHQEDDWSSPSLRQLLHMTAPEWKRSLLGITGALGFGAIQPIHSYIMGALLSSYFLNDPNEIRSKTKSYCSLFLINGFLAFITNVIQHYNFGVTGEYLTKRVRQMMLTKTLTFEIGWFDTDNNSSGVICSRLSAEASKVRRLVCDRISLFAHTLSAAVLAIILSMALSWRLAVVIVALQPLIIGSFYGRGVLMKSMSKKVLKAQQTSTNIASECVWNHRIIMAFTSQGKIMELFSNTLGASHRESKKQSWYAGLGLLVSQFLTAANVGLIFWYGGRLLHQGMITYKHLFQTFFILVTTGRVIAEAGAMTSDLSKGASAIKSVFMILSRKSKIEPNDPDGIRPQKIDGYVEFKEVSFVYPSRPDHIIFNALSLKVDAGRTVALVGQSGSGKSTIIALVERFYDTLKGSVEIDGVDIKRYNLRALRSHIALVSQEPTLFADSVHENIAYGKENATEAEVIEAATLANAHEFISGMKDGYKTYCGERGLQLSGGQKQRIALARAILKNPAILLLDEATSALDYRSESLVQEAMERIFVKRTCLVVAHRISTIKKSDSIAVVANRRIVEEGTHDDLMSRGENGAYYSLVKIQSEGLKTRPTNI